MNAEAPQKEVAIGTLKSNKLPSESCASALTRNSFDMRKYSGTLYIEFVNFEEEGVG